MNRAAYGGDVTNPEALPVGGLFAERLRHFRKLRGLSVPELAKRCAEAGMPELTDSSLTNLERPTNAARPRRRASIDELLTLAYVLQVPPVALLTQIETPGDLEPVPGVTASGWDVIRWVSGEARIDGSDISHDPGAAPVVLRRRHQRYEDDYLAAMRDLGTPFTPEVRQDAAGEYNFPVSPVRTVTAAKAAAAVTGLRDVRATMRMLGIDPPPLPEDQGLRTAVGEPEVGDG